MEKISKRFGSTVALNEVDFKLKKGEIHALIGENGAGKSTLMKILSGALRPDSGKIFLEDKLFKLENPIEARKYGISMIYQELNLAPHLNAIENIMLGIEENTSGFLKRTIMRNKVKSILEILRHSEISLDVPVYKLSLSAQQIIEIARALVLKSKIIVMDEPTSSLSGDDMENLFKIIKELKKEGISIIYISHFLEEIKKVADRYTVLRDGRNAGNGIIENTSIEDLIGMMLGRKLDEMFPRIQPETGVSVLELDSLCGRKFPENVNLSLHKGEILGITGLIGAGRTEMLKTIYGLEPIKSGKIKILGISFSKVYPREMLLNGVGYLSENRKEEGLALSRTVADNITLSYFRPYAKFGWINLKKQREYVNRWIEKLEINVTGSDQKTSDLSGGNQQKVAIARLLHTDSDILLLDEPTRGIDVKSKVQIYKIIGELANKGKAIIFVSSYIPELLGICNRVAVMHRGKIVEIRFADEWDEHEIMIIASIGKPYHQTVNQF
ncbi:MAG: sugar ABC transporter ATP-binding protein [Acidobacteriota bacterium]